MKRNEIYLGDCLELMPKHIEDKSVDMIFCDLPYGTTKCYWDEIIPFCELWSEYERIIKDNGAIVLFGSEPFSSKLRLSNLKLFKYDWIWRKNTCTGIAQANYQPMKEHETISVFYKKKPIFNKTMTRTKSEHIASCAKKGLERKINTKSSHNSLGGHYGGKFKEFVNPRTVLEFKSLSNRDKRKIHPTQKPIELINYLISTYTNKGDLVLDNCSGSGTVGQGCIELKRDFILMEQDVAYYEDSRKRLQM